MGMFLAQALCETPTSKRNRTMKAIFAGLFALTLVACGKGSNQNSVVQSIASTANDKLIADVEANENAIDPVTGKRKEMKLSDVIAKKEYYGLSEKEVKIIHESFTAEEYARLVLNFVDPNSMRGRAAPRWAFIPNVSDDNAEELRRIEVVDKSGNNERIDGIEDPDNIDYPIITLSFSERIEGAVPLKLADAPAADGGLMMNNIEFSNVHEPWIKGKAEMYAVISFFGKDGKGTSALVELPSVDKKNTRYDLRQIVHMWPENKYQIANIAFFEHDSGYNYASLSKIFVTAAASIVTSVVDPSQTTTIAVAGIVSELANKVIDARPSGFYTDDDDYVDTINTIEKYSPGFRSGVSGNAKVEFSFYEVKLNDE
jgi:hypothetical protein